MVSINSEKLSISKKRSCGKCSKCCEGYLRAQIYGEEMFRGRNCAFLEKDDAGCTIYENRPESPCKEFECAWLEDENIPSWLKPSISNAIITRNVCLENGNLNHYRLTEAGEKLRSDVLNWFIQWALSEKHNIIYEISGKSFAIGNNVDFVEFAKDITDSSNSKEICI